MDLQGHVRELWLRCSSRQLTPRHQIDREDATGKHDRRHQYLGLQRTPKPDATVLRNLAMPARYVPRMQRSFPGGKGWWQAENGPPSVEEQRCRVELCQRPLARAA